MIHRFMKLIALHLSLVLSSDATSSPAPNVILFLADDLGQQDVGCYNNGTVYETPKLDAFAKEGTLFTHAYAASPVCSPTRYALHTGRWPTRGGMTSFLVDGRSERFRGAELSLRMAPDETTLAEAVREQGYYNVFVGKWHLGSEPSDWPEAHGFETNIAGCSQGHPASWFSPYKNPRLADGPPGEYLSSRLTDETVAQLKKAKTTGKRFFICHSFYEVHTPLQAPADLVRKYQDKARRLGVEAEFRTEQQNYLSGETRKVRQNQTHAEYAAKVEIMDQSVGRILKALDELDLAGTTLVMFTSDNGGLSTSEGTPTSNLPFRAGKGWLYEGGLRVPLLLRWPGVSRAGIVVPTPVTTLDLYPTIVTAAGGNAGSCDGLNLAPLLKGEVDGYTARDLFWHFPHYGNQGGFPGAAMRHGNWKLIEGFEDGALQLYDLATDPAEKNNLAGSQADLASMMKARLHAWYEKTGAKFLRAKDSGPAPWTPVKRR